MSPRVVDPDRVAEVEASIVEAARDLLAEGGPARLSMRQVADRVGVSAAALYRYFENKEALVRQVIGQAFLRFGEYLERAAGTQPRGSLERVQALGEAYLEFATENEAYFRVLFSIQRDDPRALEDIPEGGGFDLLREAVEDAIPGPAFKTGDVISFERLEVLKNYLPEPFWENREMFFYEGMQLEIGEFYKEYPPSVERVAATEKFGGLASIGPDESLVGFTMGQPFPCTNRTTAF